MAKPVTESFHQMVLEVEGETPGSWRKICGITGRTITRTTNMSETEVPSDCEDESLPADVEVEPQSKTVSVTGTAVWASQSHGFMMDWWYESTKLNIRVGHLRAEPGDTEYETGPAFLVNVTDSVEKTGGGKVAREIEIRFAGLPTRVPAESGS